MKKKLYMFEKNISCVSFKIKCYENLKFREDCSLKHLIIPPPKRNLYINSNVFLEFS